MKAADYRVHDSEDYTAHDVAHDAIHDSEYFGAHDEVVDTGYDSVHDAIHDSPVDTVVNVSDRQMVNMVDCAIDCGMENSVVNSADYQVVYSANKVVVG